jgi:hypothetical protein
MANIPAIPLATLRLQTRQQVGDPVRYAPDGVTILAGPQTWTDAQVNEAVNFAIVNLCQKTRKTLTENPNAIDSTGHIVAPTEAIEIVDLALDDGTGVPLLDTQADFEDMRDPAWRTRMTGTPLRYIPETKTSCRVIPGTPTTNLLVRYIEAPVALVNDADVPDARIPNDLHVAIQFGAAAYLLQQDIGDAHDEQASQIKMAMFDGLIGYANPDADKPKPGGSGR